MSITEINKKLRFNTIGSFLGRGWIFLGFWKLGGVSFLGGEEVVFY